MRQIVLATVLLALAATAAAAQVKNKPANGPFGTEWAKPTGETGGYIYNDPRLQERNRSGQPVRAPICPPGKNFSGGRCQ